MKVGSVKYVEDTEYKEFCSNSRVKEIVDDREIREALAYGEDNQDDEAIVRHILEKARNPKTWNEGLDLFDVSVLLHTEDDRLLKEIYKTAWEVKRTIYGRRLVLFAPLYIDNRCSSNCLYCGFRVGNKSLKRVTLSMQEIAEETKAIVAMGHKRVLLVSSDNPSKGVDYYVEAMKTIYSVRGEPNGRGEIRRINVNVAPLTVEEFEKLQAAGIGTYQCFQETYHRETYKKLHPSGPKSDYNWRITVMDRAYAAGIDDLALGVLYGLYDYKYDTLAVISHGRYLNRTYGVGPHTISIPRLRPALGAPMQETEYMVSDEELKKITAVLRLAVPYTGLILSTREPPELRDELFGLGISQASAASRTWPGGYKQGIEPNAFDVEQFEIEDTRNVEQIMQACINAGYIPSFCTACYRRGRTGEVFMALAKSGAIKKRCDVNAILTFYEYLIDYAPNMIDEGKKLIKTIIDEIDEPRAIKVVEEGIRRLEDGERDLYL